MTDKEIIKGLEAHLAQRCGNCPYDNGINNYCITPLMKDALDLINRQQAEIDRLEEEAAVEIADGGASCHLCIKVHTDKAIKKFANNLKKNLTGWDTNATDEEIEYYIERVATEMVGADNETLVR